MFFSRRCGQAELGTGMGNGVREYWSIAGGEREEAARQTGFSHVFPVDSTQVVDFPRLVWLRLEGKTAFRRLLPPFAAFWDGGVG